MLIKKSQKYYDADASVGGEGTTPPANEPNNQGENPIDGSAGESPVKGKARVEFEKIEAALKLSREENAALKKLQTDSENAKLAEEGKYKELYEKSIADREAEKSEFNTQNRTNSIKNELIKNGLSLEAVEALLPSVMQKVQFGEDNNANNLAEVVANIKTNLPQLFEAPKAAPIGSMGVPATVNNNSVAIDPEKLTDSEYVQRNFAAVKEYMKNNN
jgi:ribosomal protein S21